MRSNLNEIARIDQYLFRQLNEEDHRIFEAQLVINNVLAGKVEAQRLTHRLIKRYSRKQALGRIEGIYLTLLEEPAFAREVKSIFF